MLSKEEVLDIIAYCKENNVRRKDRLTELGIRGWSFYEARRRYLNEETEEGRNEGRFVQLRSTGEFVPESITEMERNINPGKRVRTEPVEMKIECQTPRGGILRMTGKIPREFLSVILQSI